MKIKPEDYVVLKTKLDAVVKRVGVDKVKEFIKEYTINSSLIWQLYHASYIDEPELKLYDYLNDSHIETAVRKYIKESELLK